MKSPHMRPRCIVVGVALAAAMLALAACATPTDLSSSETTPPATERAGADMTATPVAGDGPTGWPGVDFPIPAGARSVIIDFTCDGEGSYSVELGDSMALNQATISGSCEAEHPLSWPVMQNTGPTIAVTVDEGVAWTAAPRFSAAEFSRDPAVTADCAAFTDVYSALVNADEGFTNYAAFDAAEWSARVSTASAQLGELAAASTSTLAAPLADMAKIVATAAEPGKARTGTDDSVAQVAAACNANQTPFVIMAEFGG